MPSPSGIGDSGGHLRESYVVHPTLYNRVLGAKKFGNPCLHLMIPRQKLNRLIAARQKPNLPLLQLRDLAWPYCLVSGHIRYRNSCSGMPF